MEHTQMNQSPEMNPYNGQESRPEPQAEQKQERKQMGPVMGIVIIIIIMVFGGLYFWGARINDLQNETEEIPLILGDDGSDMTPSQTTNDSPESIEEDFDTTDIDELGTQIEADLSTIELELR